MVGGVQGRRTGADPGGLGSPNISADGRLTTSTEPNYIQENFEISALPEDATREIREGIKTNVRFNAVVGIGVPGLIPRAS